ncbi:methionyl-tRNA formyltransferase [bacterium BMS3Abin07]|nr:methionyl-tRNA formyltransferase [bacterium BMS3Abin07]GBE32105.1 methionyl-tRNA formyltransferase [bacterium BMS3Bbin05]HDZ88613.1 methionyl-tRNA formyltransferase [Nitrospirota bacterium]
MAIIFIGTPDFAVPSLQALINNNEDIPLVITQPDKKRGRGRKVSQPAIKIAAEKNNIEVRQPDNINDSVIIESLASLSPEFIVVAAYGRILGSGILKLPEKGCINVHASLLPKYRGAAPVQWAIINGEKLSGVTTMLMDEGVDTGDILLQQEVIIERTDTSATLSERLSNVGADILIDTIRGIRNNSIKPRRQTGTPSYAPALKKRDGRIDWSKDAESLFNFIRGMYPWPCAYTYLKGKYCRILESEAVEGSGTPGTVETISGNIMLIGSGDGLIGIKRLQPEGKKPLDVRAFVNGYRLNEGDRFD